MKVNRNFKDSVFTKLFSEPELLRDLYCALAGNSIPESVPVSINTLEKVLYMDLYNDISFEIGGKLIVLIEHQSTINPNMPLRMLFYISKILEKTIKRKGLYTEMQLTVPWPEFYVLYNGKKPYPEETTLKLSELFEKTQKLSFQEKAHPLLELEVKVLNINEGKNDDKIKRCAKLAEYSAFVTITNEYMEETDDKEKALEEAIIYCQNHDILKEFLEKHGTEVLYMLLEEWNIDDAKEVWQEDARAEGIEQGMAKGKAEIIALLKKGISLEEIEKMSTK